MVLQAADGGKLTIQDPQPTTATATAIATAAVNTLKSGGYTIKNGPTAVTLAGAPAFDLAAVSPDGKTVVVLLAAVHGGDEYAVAFGIPARLAASTPDSSGLDQIQQQWAWSDAATSSTSAPPAADRHLRCPAGAHWCDTFDKNAGGWTTTNTSDVYANFLAYQGGTYRVNQRVEGIAMISSPHSIVDASPVYGVKIDADVGVTSITGLNPGFGLSCWNAKISSGGAGAYSFIVTATDATLVYFPPGQDGQNFATKKFGAGVVHTAPAGLVSWNHLQMSCAQTGEGNAHFMLSINGQAVVSEDYPGSSATARPVDPGPGYGVLAAGKGADVFYDNIALTGLPGQ